MFVWTMDDVVTITAIVISVSFGIFVFASEFIEDFKNKYKKNKDKK